MTFPLFPLIIFAIFWIACMIRPADRAVWLTENSLTVAFVALLIWMHPRWPVANLSYMRPWPPWARRSR